MARVLFDKRHVGVDAHPCRSSALDAAYGREHAAQLGVYPLTGVELPAMFTFVITHEPSASVVKPVQLPQ